MLGGQSGILPHKDFRGKGMMFFGTPARPVHEYFKELATLSRLTRKKETGSEAKG
jgi:UDP-3-O-[3-hydroxymyristoyl] glucosamine N-acyltransferase